MPIQLRRVYDPPERPGGYAVFVDRLWPRGLKKSAAWWDEWCKEIAPSPELRTWFGHDPARFDEFTKRYRAELAEPDKHAIITRWAALPELTLVYAARDPKINHAIVLRDAVADALR